MLGQCKACSKDVSTEAMTCPNCGQPDPCTIPHPKVKVGETYSATTFQQGFFSVTKIQPGFSVSLIGRPLNPEKTFKVKVVKADPIKGIVCGVIDD